MTQDEYCGVAYRLGHRFARKLLGDGKCPDFVRLAMQRAQEHLLALRAYSPELDDMKRSGCKPRFVFLTSYAASPVFLAL